MNDLTGKIALITGATSGIGAASAIRFGKAGAKVICTGRNVARGNDVVRAIKSTGGFAVFHEMDITQDSSIEKVANQIKSEFGKLDILFNNAGVFPMPTPIEAMTREDFEPVMNSNVVGTVMSLKYFLPLIDKGVVLNCSSMSGLDSYVNGQNYAYDASKAAIIKISKLMAKRFGAKIRFNVICPGVIRTPIWLNFNEERHVVNIPVGRVGEPEDIASVANFLASDDAGFINGAVITVDGGQSL